MIGDSGWNLQANARGFGFRINDAALAHNARRIFATYLRGHAGAGAECDAAELIFGEILGNVARHAPGSVEVSLRWNGLIAILEIYDDGPGYDVGVAELPEDAFSESSRGLFLVAAFGGRELRTYRMPDGRNVTHVILPVRKRRLDA